MTVVSIEIKSARGWYGCRRSLSHTNKLSYQRGCDAVCGEVNISDITLHLLLLNHLILTHTSQVLMLRYLWKYLPQLCICDRISPTQNTNYIQTKTWKIKYRKCIPKYQPYGGSIISRIFVFFSNNINFHISYPMLNVLPTVFYYSAQSRARFGRASRPKVGATKSEETYGGVRRPAILALLDIGGMSKEQPYSNNVVFSALLWKMCSHMQREQHTIFLNGYWLRL